MYIIYPYKWAAILFLPFSWECHVLISVTNMLIRCAFYIEKEAKLSNVKPNNCSKCNNKGPVRFTYVFGARRVFFWWKLSIKHRCWFVIRTCLSSSGKCHRPNAIRQFDSYCLEACVLIESTLNVSSIPEIILQNWRVKSRNFIGRSGYRPC